MKAFFYTIQQAKLFPGNKVTLICLLALMLVFGNFESNAQCTSPPTIAGNPAIGCLGTTTTLAPFSATGGTVTTNSGYRIHTFTSSGTFTPNASGTVEVLVVAGGGGGAGGNYDGGGGGAGGLLYSSSYTVSAGTPIAVTVGAGGAGGTTTNAGTNGSNSIFGTLTPSGGGGGGNQGAQSAKIGGSGGGGAGGSFSGAAGMGGQGYSGGNGYNGGVYGAGGGGGAGAVGTAGSASLGGNGGTGLQYAQFASVGGSPAGWFAGGGGGSANANQSAIGTGGQGGGGNGSSTTAPTAGTPNTGGGGGGAERAGVTTGGAGGSGIVIVRYLDYSGGTWTSDNTGVASIDPSSGVVTGNAAGSANINYGVTVGACTYNVPTSVSVTATPAATASASTPVCTNGTLTLTGGPSGMTSYSWSGPNGFSSTLQNPATINSPTTAASGAYTLTVVDATCSSSATVSVTVNPVVTASGTISGAASVCAGQTGVVYSTTTIANATSYSWTVPSTLGTISGASNGSSITVTISGSASSGNITVAGVSAGGCGNGPVATYAVSVISPPPALTGNQSITCPGSTTTFTPASGTGGTVTQSGGYYIHTFTSTGTASFTPAYNGNVEVLVVAGGGGGGGGNYDAGGGGAGGLVYNSSVPVSAGTPVTVTVGAGGAGGSGTGGGTNGGNSVFASLTATGGGGGATQSNVPKTGGSGGGGAGSGGTPSYTIGATGTAAQGNSGGNGDRNGSIDYGGGGGGGAGAVGAAGTNTTGGNGGAGLQYAQFASVGGSPAGWFAGGGGGSLYSDQTHVGIGGAGGGGNGSATTAPTAGTPNTGGGGGAAERNGVTTGGAGGSGIVIVRYASYYSGGTWSSDNTGVATVDGSGVVTGVANGTANITYTYTSGSCSYNVTRMVTVSTTPVPATAGSNTPVCSDGVSSTLSLTSGPSGYAYSWSGPNGFTSTAQNPTITGPTTLATGNYTVTVTNGQCNGTTSTSAVVNMIVSATGVISGSSGVCPGETGVVYSTTIANAATYNWTVPSSLGTISGASNGSSITVTISGSPTAGNISVYGVSAGSCGNGPSSSYAVSIISAPTISGNTNITCLGATTTLTPFSATGGTITTSGGYRIHAFTSSGTFTPNASGNVEVMVVAGGGGGGGGNYEGGGGGAGGLLYNSSYAVSVTPMAITVGAGGAGGTTTNAGTNGSNSVFGTLTAVGGGGGSTQTGGQSAKVGGSGGGGAGSTSSPSYTIGAAGTAGQGNSGGNGLQNGAGTSDYGSGGGGGAGAVGGNGATLAGGNGGAGLQYAQFAGVGGSPAGWFAGGGGGSVNNTNAGYVVGAGGNGGGGAGGTGAGVSGTANTGGGGGGAERSGTPTGGSGGSGIVIVRYPDYSGGSWSSDNTAVASVNPSTGVVTGVAAGSANIIYTYAAGGCTFNIPTSVTVTSSTTATANASTPVCTNGTLTLTGGPASMTSYSWSGPNGFTSSLQNPPTINNPTTGASGTYTLTVINGTCNASATVAVVVSPVVTASGTISGPATVCSGQTGAVYSTTAIANATSYSWTVPSNMGTINGASNGTSITVDISASGASGNITVAGVSGGGCGNGPVATYAVSVVSPPPALTGNQSITCPGATTTYSVSPGTGGTITHTGGYYIHTFTSSGTFTPAYNGSAEVLVVAGGGGGGGGNYEGGGGGAGGLLYNSSYSVSAGTPVSITVGAGGAGGSGSNAGTNGSNSIFGTLTAIGGGGGSTQTGGQSARVGGSGGGGSGSTSSPSYAIGAAGTAGQGNSGGNGLQNGLGSGDYGSGGGGGAGAVGGNGAALAGGNGGAGLQYAQFAGVGGAPAGWFAGGGGGSVNNTNAGYTVGAGGNGGGGAGGTGAGVSGIANTGGGGGGAERSGTPTGGSGGSGIVVIRYPDYSGGSWSSDNTGVATVDGSGVITGVANGTATITYTYIAGTCSYNVTRTVTVSTTPVSATASATTPVCSDGVSSTLSLTGGPSGYTYAWAGPNAYSSTVQNPVITGPTTAASGTYTLTVSNGQCNGTTTASAVVNMIVTASGTISGPAIVCQGQNSVVYSTAIANAATYNWTVPSTLGTIIGASNGSSITINISNSAVTGNISVAGVSAGSCGTGPSSNYLVSVASQPAISGGQTIACAGGTTTFSAAVGTGGTVTTSGGYRFHTFTSSGTFTPNASGTVEVLVVAGGGGGGGGNYEGGGGGAGGLLYNSSYSVSAGTPLSITVGAGGAGGSATNAGTNGSNSVFGTLTAIGGGGGSTQTGGQSAKVGGSGGGGAGSTTKPSYTIGAAGTAGQGNSGGIGWQNGAGSSDYGSGGGGGGGAVGDSGKALAGGAGGAGLQYSQFASVGGSPAGWFAGGGGGSVNNTNAGYVVGAGGNGGGGAGGTGAGVSGIANTGGGGGGAERSGTPTGGSGGSGIVIIRYPDYSGGSWSSDNTNVATVNASGVVTGVSTGTATITYLYSVGTCSYNATRTVTVSTTPITATAGGTTPVCSSGTNSALTLSGSGPDGFTYSWSGPNGFTSTAQNPVVNSPSTLAGGIYSLTITANGSCTATASSNSIVVNPVPQQTQMLLLCAGQSVTINGHTYTASGTYVDRISGIASTGCDSIITTNLSVFFNTGTPSFTKTDLTTAPAGYPNGPRAITIGDFNNDGKMDMVIASYNGGSSMYMALNNGSGGFTVTPLTDITGASMVVGVANADFNGDGNADLLVANNASTISFALGNGNGTFKTATSISVGTNSSPDEFVTGDFNHDGHEDFALSCGSSDSVLIYIGHGDGTFAPEVSYHIGHGAEAMIGADFNGDGNIDLATPNYYSNNASILLGNSTGGFGAAISVPSSGTNPVGIAAADFNGDGKIDLAIANQTTNNISIFTGNGAGVFTSTVTVPVAGGSGITLYGLTGGDVNGDGIYDLITSNDGSNNISILLGDGSGGFSSANNVATGSNVTEARLGDFNGDGKPDIAVANNGSGTTSVLTNSTPTLLPTIIATATPSSICLNDNSSLASSGGVSYTWAPSIGLTLTTGTSVTASPPANTTYTVTGTDAHGCTSTGSTTITLKTPVPLTVNPQSAVCTGQTNAELTASGAATYVWAPTGNLTPSTGTSSTETAQISQLTFYTVTGTGADGCTANAIIPVATVATGGAISPAYSIICSGGTKTLTVTGAAGHDYQWQISSDNINWSNITGATNTTYTTLSSDGNTNEFYRLMAQSNSCWNVASTTGEVDISNPNIVVSATNITDNSLTLNWSPTGTGNYSISYSGPSSATFTSVTPAKTITGLTANGTYSITVTQTGVTGCPASGTLTGVTTLCAMPTGVTLSSPAPSQIQVSWTGVVGADYRVYYRPLFSYNTYFTKDVSNASSVLLTKQGANNIYASTTYEVYVSRLDCPTTGVVGQGTNPTNVTTLPTVTCATPVIDSVRSLCPVQIEVFIHDNGVNQYNVFLQRVTPSILAVNSYGVSGTYFTINTPYSGDQYIIAVEARCGSALSSLYVYPGNVTVKPLCNAPNNLVLSNPTCHGFTASWNADQCLSNSASSYDFYMRVAGTINYNSYGASLPPSGIGPNKLINWATSGRTYQVFVRSVYNCNGFVTYGPTSDVETVTTLSSGCRDEDAQQPQENKPATQQYSPDNSEVFSLYPNPNTGKFIVDLSRLNMEEDAVRIEVINMLGQTVLTHLTTISGGHMSEYINLPGGTAAGTYIVRLTAGKNVYTAKINVSK